MATPINTLKNWFKTNLYPTQAQFWAWLDSYWHKDEKIPMESVAGLPEAINRKAETAQITDIEKQVTSFKQEVSLEVSQIGDSVNQQLASFDKTGQLLPVLAIVEPASLEKSVLPASEIFKLPEFTAHDSYADFPVTIDAGEVLFNYARVTQRSYDGDKFNVCQLDKSSSSHVSWVEYPELKGIRNIYVKALASSANRVLGIYLNGEKIHTLNLVTASVEYEVTLPERYDGVLKIQSDSTSGGCYLYDVRFDYDDENGDIYPDGVDGDRYIFREGEDSIIEMKFGEWQKQAVAENYSVRVAADDGREYVKLENRFVCYEKPIDLTGYASKEALADNAAEHADFATKTEATDKAAAALAAANQYTEQAVEASKPDLSGLIPKSDFTAAANKVVVTGWSGINCFADFASLGLTGYRYDEKGNKSTYGYSYTLPRAYQDSAGLMTASDKKKLDNIEPGAQVNEVTNASLAVTLTNYLTEEETRQAIAESEVGLFNFKGEIESRDELPTDDVAEFDVYKIIDEQKAVFAIYLEDALYWKPLSPEFDLTGYETTAGATEKANAAADVAEENAKAYTDEAIEAITQPIAAEKLPFVDKTEEAATSGDGDNAAFTFDFAQGNIFLDFTDPQGRFHNITTENVEVGDVRYLVLKHENYGDTEARKVNNLHLIRVDGECLFDSRLAAWKVSNPQGHDGRNDWFDIPSSGMDGTLVLKFIKLPHGQFVEWNEYGTCGT
jgi:hypothetical protein